MYVVIWKYVVEFENKTEFEFKYGEDGIWNTFFRTSEEYKGSYLNLFEDRTGTHLLIDIWNDRESYESFIKENKGEYDRLSGELRHLYKLEQKIRVF